MKNEDELIALKDKDLEQVVGGMPEEEFQHLEIGARVLVIHGDYRSKYGTVYGFVDDVVHYGVHLCAKVMFDDGTDAYLSACEINRE